MKLWILTSELPPDFNGGIARYVETIAPVLAESGVDVTVVTRAKKRFSLSRSPRLRVVGLPDRYTELASGDTQSSNETHPAFPYNVLSYWPAFSYQVFQELNRLVDELGTPDVIETQEYSAISYYLAQAKLRGERPWVSVRFVVHLHSPTFELSHANDASSASFPEYWIGQMEKWVIASADALTCPSSFLAEKVKCAIPSVGPIDVIPLPIADRCFANASAKYENDREFVYFGRLELRKGVLRLLSVFSDLWDSGNRLQLRLIGGDTTFVPRGESMRGYIERRFNKYLRSGLLFIEDSLPFDEVMRRVDAARAVVIPSLWENFPNTCIEAMARQKVVIVSDEGGQAEIVQDGVSGRVFSWSREESLRLIVLQELERTRESALEIGRNAQSRVRQFCGFQNSIHKRVSVYQRVILSPRAFTAYPVVYELAKQPKNSSPLSSNPLVSVIIPFYNLGAYLSEAVESVLTSTYQNLEILIVDDGSDDLASVQVAERLAERHANIRLIRSRNSGLAAARNLGAEKAHGPLLFFLDADDKVSGTFIDEAVSLCKLYPDVGFVFSWVRYFGDSHAVWPTFSMELPYMLGHNMSLPLGLVRADAWHSIGGNDPAFCYNYEDYECWLRLVLEGWKAVSIPKVHSFYRVRPGSLSRLGSWNQFTFLYEKLIKKHAWAYRAWGAELAALQLANGSALAWINPSLSQKEIPEKLISTLERRERQLDCSVGIRRLLDEGAKLHEVMLRSPSGPLDPASDQLRDYIKVLQEVIAYQDSRLVVVEESEWEGRVGGRLVRRMRQMPFISFVLRSRRVRLLCERIIGGG